MARQGHGLRGVAMAVTVATALTATQPVPAAERAAVAGRVHDSAGAPVAEAMVIFVDQEAGGRHRAVSDAEGRWEIQGLAPGRYWIEVQREGFLKLVPGALEVAAGTTSGVDFTLDRRGRPRPEPPSAMAPRTAPPVETGRGEAPTAPPPEAMPVRRAMEALLPGGGPVGRPAAGSAAAKAATVLLDELGGELGVDDLPRKAPPTRPADWSARRKEADSARFAGDTGVARAAYRRLIADDPAAVEPFVGLAECAVADGRPDEGLDLLRRIGTTLVRVGRYADAVAVLERALELVADDAELWAALGQSRVEQLHHRAAIPALERAVALGRDDLRTDLYLAAAHWEVGDLVAAETAFVRALEVHGASFELLWRLGRLLIWQGRNAEAADLLARARAFRDDHVPMVAALARAEAGAGRIEAAIASYRRVLELAPDHGPARHAVAVLTKRRDQGTSPPLPAPEPSPDGRGIVLTPIAPPGLTFRHDPGPSVERYLPEIMGSGLAWLDYDGDGWWDVYLVQSGAYPPDGGPRAKNRLFRNRGPDADGRIRFQDVTERAGVGDRGFGFGAVAADVDGDGRTDLLVTNLGADTYLRNRGDGSFEDRTADAGLGGEGWSASAALADADGDGDLDLYVARYIDYRDRRCRHRETGVPDYCDIDLFEGIADRYYRNDTVRSDTVGSDRASPAVFAERTAAAGLEAIAPGRGLGVLWLDLDGDGVSDLYVANDLTPNALWRGRGDGTFEDVSLLSGTAHNWQGEVEAGMGLAAGDVDADGDADLAVTNYDIETNTLYRNLGDLQFDDAATASGFGPPSFNLLGFGLLLADFDRDGDLDAYVANGHVIERPYRKVVDFLQADLLLAGDGLGGFVVNGRIGPPALGRGAATADFDGDGDPDVMVQNNRGAPSVLLNDVTGGSWLGVRLRGRGANAEAVGARVRLEVGGRWMSRWVTAGDSYLSSSDRRVLFGWSTAEDPAALEVDWPSGRRSRIERPPAGRYLLVVEPAGR